MGCKKGSVYRDSIHILRQMCWEQCPMIALGLRNTLNTQHQLDHLLTK